MQVRLKNVFFLLIERKFTIRYILRHKLAIYYGIFGPKADL